MRRRFLALATALPVLLLGCSGASRHSSDPTTSGGGQPQAAAPNPDVVPAVITPAYVNAVFAVLNHINGNATRQLAEFGRITRKAEADFRAAYNDPLFEQELRIARQSLASGFGNVRRPPGDIETTVVQIISSGPRCVFVATNSNFGAVLLHPGRPAASEYWVLRPKQSGDDPTNLNPTPWALGFNAVYLTPQTIPDQCAGS